MRKTDKALLFVLVVGVVGCDDDDDMLGPSNAPNSHTIAVEGALHMEGLRDPETNCTPCHGADLRGGEDGEPSCYSCHGKKWP